MFRPPSEARSLIIRVADGCPHNTCTFCGMYKGVAYRPHELAGIRSSLRRARDVWPHAQRVFLADGDVMALPFETLRAILQDLNDLLPRLVRVSLYANGRSIQAKSDGELRQLRALKLQTLYMGLESGDPETLRRVGKRDTPQDMIGAARRARESGLRLSVMILLGLAGRSRSKEHATASAEVVNRMQPPLLAALRYVPVPGTPLGDAAATGDFPLLTEQEAAAELRRLIAGLQLQGAVFRANHASNVVPLGGRLPRDKELLLASLDELLESGALDSRSPGPMPTTL